MIKMHLFFYPIFLSCFFINVMQAQLTPQFESTFYFEDAVGNKDTLVYGFDDRTGEGVDPEFGEEDISAIPMDSVFEVRMIGVDDFNNSPNFPNPHYKKFIGRVANYIEPLQCYDFKESAMIIVSAKHLPIVIRWESEPFDSSYCTIGSALNTQSISATVFNWFQIPEFIEEHVCLSENSSLMVDFQLSDPYLDEWTYYSRELVEGIGIDSVYGIALGIAAQGPNSSNPCDESFNFDLLDATMGVLSDDFQIFPNPTDGYVHFSDFANFEVFNNQGQRLLQGKSVQQLSLSNFPSGIYFLKIEKEVDLGYRKILLE